MAGRTVGKTNTSYTEENPKGWEAFVVREAITLLENKMKKTKRKGEVITSPQASKQLARVVLGGQEREHFWVAFLTNRHQLIEHKILFSGTVDGATVYPREVVKEALRLNAAAVILAHNHPSGHCLPSQDDIEITRQLKQALALVDVRVLDHIIVGEGKPVSLSEMGKM